MENVFKDTYCIIVSAERPEFSKEINARRSSALLEKLLDIVQWDGQVIPSEGKYKNSIEQSYTIVYSLDDINNTPKDVLFDIMHSILLCADYFDQEAIMTVVNGEATIYTLDDSDPSLIGNMEITTDVNSDYTKINNTLYTIV